MAKTTVTIDGQRVSVGTAQKFYKLRAAFRKAFPGLDLKIRSGLRTWDYQLSLWNDYQNGGTYALHPSNPNALHYEGNPRGGASLDVYDTGSDNGVTVAGNPRSNWLRNNAAKYGFWARGYNFGEPWHIEANGDPWAGKLTPTTPTGNLITDKEMKLMALYAMSYKHGKEYDVTVFSENGFEFSYMTTDSAMNNKIAKRWGTKSFVDVGNSTMINKLRLALSRVRSKDKEYETV